CLNNCVNGKKSRGRKHKAIGQFCDSDLEVEFRRNAYFVRNLEGVDLLKGDCSTNLYTINLHEMASASPICLMARVSSTKSWLWHQRLSHLNFDTINDLARNDLVEGLSKFKYHKEHLCPSSIAISCSPVQHSRTKHIAVRYHFIKEHVEKGTIELYFFKTDYQLTDIFTKALPADRFNSLVRRLGMRNLSPQELERLAKSQ
nr:retrovirus-related Pol polyprotein from transposon TNT 1-94 [Tanacetum cinerariifolium]